MDKLTRKERSLIILAFSAVFVIIIVVSLILTSIFKARSKENLSPMKESEATVILDSDLQAENETKTPFTKDLVAGFEYYVLTQLSLGAYDDLTSYLKNLSDNYRDGDVGDTGIGVSYTAIVDMYRSDLTSILSITDSPNPSFNLQNYYYPETLASAFIYSPISYKIDAVLDVTSLILPGLTSDRTAETNLTKVELTTAEIAELTEQATKALQGYTVTGVAQYDFSAYKLPWRITIVCLDNHLWSIQRLDCLNETSASAFMTVADLKSARLAAIASGQDFNYDTFLTIAG